MSSPNASGGMMSMGKYRIPITDLLTACRALRVAEADATKAESDMVSEESDGLVLDAQRAFDDAMARREEAIGAICAWLEGNDGPLPPAEE